MSLGIGRGIGRHEKGRFQPDITSRCYGCARPFIPDCQGNRAQEVLCKRCSEGTSPQAVDGLGLLLADKDHA